MRLSLVYEIFDWCDLEQQQANDPVAAVIKSSNLHACVLLGIVIYLKVNHNWNRILVSEEPGNLVTFFRDCNAFVMVS